MRSNGEFSSVQNNFDGTLLIATSGRLAVHADEITIFPYDGGVGPQFRYAGQAFTLDAFVAEVRQEDVTFAKPVILHVGYTDEQVARIVEGELLLYVLENGQWVDAAATCAPASTYTRNLGQNTLAVEICHLSRFALFGPESRSVYLPVIAR